MDPRYLCLHCVDLYHCRANSSPEHEHVYKALRQPLLDPSAKISGYVSLFRYADSLRAMQYLAIPYSPRCRIDLSVSITGENFEEFPTGNKYFGPLCRRSWPAFDRHGGALELNLAVKVSGSTEQSDGDGGSPAKWDNVQPSMTLPRYGIDDAHEMLTDWSEPWAEVAGTITSRLLRTALAAADQRREDDERVKVFDDMPAAAAATSLTGLTDWQLCLSMLGEPEHRNPQFIGSVRLFCAAWRDDERQLERQLIPCSQTVVAIHMGIAEFRNLLENNSLSGLLQDAANALVAQQLQLVRNKHASPIGSQIVSLEPICWLTSEYLRLVS